MILIKKNTNNDSIAYYNYIDNKMVKIDAHNLNNSLPKYVYTDGRHIYILDTDKMIYTQGFKAVSNTDIINNIAHLNNMSNMEPVQMNQIVDYNFCVQFMGHKLNLNKALIKSCDIVDDNCLIEIIKENQLVVFYRGQYIYYYFDDSLHISKILTIKDNYKKFIYNDHCIYFDYMTNCMYLIHINNLMVEYNCYKIRGFKIQNYKNTITGIIFITIGSVLLFYIKFENGDIYWFIPERNNINAHENTGFICNIPEQNFLHNHYRQCFIVTNNEISCIEILDYKLRKFKHTVVNKNIGTINMVNNNIFLRVPLSYSHFSENKRKIINMIVMCNKFSSFIRMPKYILYDVINNSI